MSPDNRATAGNPWAAVAERQICAPQKARQRAAERRREALRERARERATLERAWHAGQRKCAQEFLAGPHGDAARALCRLLDNLTLADADALITAVGAGPWCETDADTRFQVLRLVDAGIVALRGKHGLPPFDDALPGEPPTAFEIIREHLR
jgi:hypothetical protein